MENQKDPRPGREDELNAENNLLKVKLGLEHGMQMDDTSSLSPDVENQWLKSVYAFEQKFKDAKRIKLYDYIGRPAFKKWDTLTPDQMAQELRDMQSHMERNGVKLSCLCKYDDTVIYRFITGELFNHEMDDMCGIGMTCHFTYEEFHPNHEYEVRDHTHNFINAVFTRTWHEEYDGITLARKVSFSGKKYNSDGISSIIRTFQEAHTALHLEKFEINEVLIDDRLSKAKVQAESFVSGQMKHGDKVRYAGRCSIHLVREEDYWSIAYFNVPGFTSQEPLGWTS